MSPPKAVKVLGMKFPIVVGGAEFDRALREMNDDGEHTRGEVLAGFCVRTRETAIYIRGGMDKAVEQDTVLHEVLHACYLLQLSSNNVCVCVCCFFYFLIITYSCVCFTSCFYNNGLVTVLHE